MKNLLLVIIVFLSLVSCGKKGMNYKNNNFYIEKIKADNLIKKYGSPIYCYSNVILIKD